MALNQVSRDTFYGKIESLLNCSIDLHMIFPGIFCLPGGSGDPTPFS